MPVSPFLIFAASQLVMAALILRKNSCVIVYFKNETSLKPRAFSDSKNGKGCHMTKKGFVCRCQFLLFYLI